MMPQFHHYRTGFKYEWYKRIGRSSGSVGENLKTLEFYEMIVECLKSVRDDPNPDRHCKVRKDES